MYQEKGKHISNLGFLLVSPTFLFLILIDILFQFSDAEVDNWALCTHCIPMGFPGLFQSWVTISNESISNTYLKYKMPFSILYFK